MTELQQDLLLNLQEKYEKARKLLDEESKNDPPTEPYRSKYKAQGILNEMKSIIINHIDSNEGSIRLRAMLGAVWLNLGITSLDTEELSTGEEQLTKCVEVLDNHAMYPECIIIIINALNQLGILWSHRDKPKTSQIFLEKAEKLYYDYLSQHGDANNEISAADLFSMPGKIEEGVSVLEKTHTLTLYYLAQIYGALNEPLRSAIYCHTTLNRQLESKDYDPIDWALNAATLSQFFATHNGFTEARHHLAAASYVLDQHRENLQAQQHEGTEEERDAKKEILSHRSADVARCWAKYGLNLLAVSQSRLLRLSDEDFTALPNVDDGSLILRNLAATSNVSPDKLEKLTFPSLELSSFEGKMPDKPASVFEEARVIFLSSKEWLERAKEYYTMEQQASDSVEITQDLSKLYHQLVFFEDNEERQCRMHKRRVDMLEDALKQLNPQFYLPVCRQLWFELAETYSEMLEIKKQKLRESNDPTPNPHALGKINSLTKSGIAHLNSFIKSLYVKGTSELPEVLQEDMERPVLLAYFYLGKLYRELITPDKEAQVNNLTASIEAYEFLVRYCEKHENVKTKMGAELGICKEMLELLPIKLRRLKSAQQP